MSGKAETLTPPSLPVDRVGLIALLVGTAIIAWSGILVRFLDVGPLAGAAWRMGLAVPALAVWAKAARRGRTVPPNLVAAAVPLVLAGLAFAVDVGSFHLAIFGTRVANATFIGNVAPILTVIGGALFFAEHPPVARLARAHAGAGRRLGDGRNGGGDPSRRRRRLRACRRHGLRRLSPDHQAPARKARRADGDAVVGGRLGGRADDRGHRPRRDPDPLDR